MLFSGFENPMYHSILIILQWEWKGWFAGSFGENSNFQMPFWQWFFPTKLSFHALGTTFIRPLHFQKRAFLSFFIFLLQKRFNHLTCHVLLHRVKIERVSTSHGSNGVHQAPPLHSVPCFSHRSWGTLGNDWYPPKSARLINPVIANRITLSTICTICSFPFTEEKSVNFLPRKMKLGTLDRGFLTLEPVGVITNPSSIPGPLSKLGIGTCLRIFKFSLSPWSVSFFFLPKYLLILSLTFNFLRLALANLIPHVIYCKNHLPVLSTELLSFQLWVHWWLSIAPCQVRILTVT